MKILVGSKNPGKIAGTEQAFLKFYKDCEIEGIPVDSMVSDEPVDDEIDRDKDKNKDDTSR